MNKIVTVVLSLALFAAVLLIRNSQYHAGELVGIAANGDSLFRSYSKESKMINEPTDAEDGSLYNAPFR
jgi:hypothetical protein